MESKEIQNRIEVYLNKVRIRLPEGVNRKEIIEELKVHINDALSDKLHNTPSESPMALLENVLNSLGSPEEIASEYHKEMSEGAVWTAKRKRMLYMIGRLVVVLFVVLVASLWISSRIPRIGFVSLVLILLLFAIPEWLIKLYQGGVFVFHEEEN